MAEEQSKMRREILEIPAALQRLLDKSQPAITEVAAVIRELDPRLICTVARGSSDHAATYLNYAIELLARIPVASIGPSVHSIYGITLDFRESACLSISQSGQSPDIARALESAKAGGALSVAITNDTKSPLAVVAEEVIDIQAGREKSVAATKTFINAIVAGLLLLAHWQEDKALLTSLHRLPDQISAAIGLDWQALVEALISVQTLLVLGRGPSFAIAQEAALKFKETCRIQGEAFSAAEVLHGPVSLVSSDYPILALIARDAAEPSIGKLADELSKSSAKVFATSDQIAHARLLPFVPTGHPLTDPLMLVIPFYAAVEELARRRGLDPDLPRHLKKVTETV